MCAHVERVVLGQQSRWQVDTHHLTSRLVDVFHQRGKAAVERFVKSRTKKTIHHQGICVQCGRFKVERNLLEQVGFFRLNDAFLVNGTVFRQLVAGVEQVDTHRVSLFRQHASHGQRIASVVSRTGKHHDGRAVGPLIGNGLG